MNHSQEWAMCGRKNSYANEAKAIGAASKFRSKFYTYKCPICACWHLTKQVIKTKCCDCCDRQMPKLNFYQEGPYFCFICSTKLVELEEVANKMAALFLFIQYPHECRAHSFIDFLVEQINSEKNAAIDTIVNFLYILKILETKKSPPKVTDKKLFNSLKTLAKFSYSINVACIYLMKKQERKSAQYTGGALFFAHEDCYD